MKATVREMQNSPFGTSGSAGVTSTNNTQRFGSVRQAVTLLRDEDPAFGNVVSTLRYGRGDVVATPEAMATRMYVLMSGKINMICTNAEGRRLVIATLEAGAVFGEGALDSAGEMNVFAEAVDDVAVWAIPAGEARNMTMQYPILGWGLLQTYGLRLLQVENSLEDVAYKKLPERLATLLIELDEDGSQVIKGISHQALADRLGTYRETVSAILRDFKRQGLVELGYRRIRLMDVEMLKEIGGIWDW